MNTLGILSILLSLAAFSISYRLLVKSPLKRKLLMSITWLILALPGASFAIYYTHLIPEAAWYYELRSTIGSELLLIPIGVFGGSISSLLPRISLTIPLLGTADFCSAPFLKPILNPLQLKLTDKWDQNVCLQSSQLTCGPASTTTILKSHNVLSTEAEIAKECHSYQGGTEAWYLARSIRKRKLNTTFTFSKNLPTSEQLPAIIGVKIGSTGHFIPVLNKQNNSYTIGDPLVGKETLDEETLKERYEFTGFIMSVSK